MHNLSTIPHRCDALRHLIQPVQDAVFDTPIMRAIHNETIRLRAYIDLLTALRAVHTSMDARLHELPLRVPIAPMRRLPALDADLRTWDPRLVLTVPPDEPLLATMAPLGLVGALFAIENLRHAMIESTVALRRAFSLSPDTMTGLTYHGTSDPHAWPLCPDVVNRLPLTAAQDTIVADGASTGIAVILACYQRIKPQTRDRLNQGPK